MMLEQPRINSKGTLEERVGYLERYLFRLVQELQAASDGGDQNQTEGGHG